MSEIQLKSPDELDAMLIAQICFGIVDLVTGIVGIGKAVCDRSSSLSENLPKIPRISTCGNYNRNATSWDWVVRTLNCFSARGWKVFARTIYSAVCFQHSFERCRRNILCHSGRGNCLYRHERHHHNRHRHQLPVLDNVHKVLRPLLP